MSTPEAREHLFELRWLLVEGQRSALYELRNEGVATWDNFAHHDKRGRRSKADYTCWEVRRAQTSSSFFAKTTTANRVHHRDEKHLKSLIFTSLI